MPTTWRPRRYVLWELEMKYSFMGRSSAYSGGSWAMDKLNVDVRKVASAASDILGASSAASALPGRTRRVNRPKTTTHTNNTPHTNHTPNTTHKKHRNSSRVMPFSGSEATLS